MHAAAIASMHEQVRAIYRAATGEELHEPDGACAEGGENSPRNADVERRFAELEALVRKFPAVGERVPPFSFTPLVDVIDAGEEIVVELLAPGVERGDVELLVTAHDLIVSGFRRCGSNGRAYVHAEIPRGPFRRVIPLPCAVDPQAELDLHDGLIAIHLRKR